MTEKRRSTQGKTVATETGPVGKYLLRQPCLILRGTEIQIPSIYVEIYQRSPRILQWIAYPFSSRSSQPRNWTRDSCIAGRFFTNWAIRKAFSHSVVSNSLQPHGLEHARLPCLSPTPGACPNSCPLNWWCHPIFSSSQQLVKSMGKRNEQTLHWRILSRY